MRIQSFKALERSTQAQVPARIAIVGGTDEAVLETIVIGLERNLVKSAIVTGPIKEILECLKKHNINQGQLDIRDTTGGIETAAVAVKAIKDGEADILMKGNIESAILFKQILHSKTGIKISKVLSNISIFELDSYHKLLGITDNGIIPDPTLEEKIAIIENTRTVYNALGISPIKVAAVAAADKVTQSMQSTLDASELKKLSESKQLCNFIIDGPFGYDVSISSSAAKKKNFYDSRVAGDPDLLLFHNLEAANAIGKSLKFHGQAKSGGIVLGASVPIMFNSRSDSVERRLNSLLLTQAVRMGAIK